MEAKLFMEFFQQMIQQKNKATNDYYLSLLMNYSIAEIFLIKYIFQRKSKSLSALPLVLSTTSSQEMSELIKFLSDNITQEHPLFFFLDILRDVNRIITEDKQGITIDKYILRLETILTWHIDTNFKTISNHPALMNESSISSVYTLFQFVKVFEYQSISTIIDKKFEEIDDYFCSNKVYYYYLDQENKEKINYGNLIDFFLTQLDTKIENYQNNKLSNSKVNNYQLENYIILVFFILKKIMVEYSFYISKIPEYSKIHQQIQKYLQYPIPIGIFTEELLDIIYNEMVFQGVSIINQFRKEFYIDLLDSNLIEIDVKDFRKNIIIVYTKKKEDYLHYFIYYLVRNDDKQTNNKRIVFRELMTKLYLTFLYNSSLDLTDEMIRNITQVLCEENDPEVIQLASKKNIVKLFDIIDKGFENKDEFNDQINVIANKLSALKAQNKLKESLPRNAYLPITKLRKYLKPTYSQLRSYDLENKTDNELKRHFNILKLYKDKFKTFARKYFDQLLQKSNDVLIEKQLKQMRNNFLNYFKINIFLFEDSGIITEFLEDLRYSMNTKLTVSQSKDDNDFWSLFTDDINTLKPNFIIYLMPHYTDCKNNPFQSPVDNDDNSDNNMNPVYLSEFIAENDAIYKSLIFMPFASVNDTIMSNYLKVGDNLNPLLYSILKKPLDYYFANSNGLLNLDVYEINLLDTDYSKLLWGSCEIKCIQQNFQTQIIFTCVDYLGLEIKEEKVERTINKPFSMKVINLFNRKHAPLNYNMTSNNGWLEVFLWDDKFDIEKSKSNINETNSNKYYEEFNYPQIDLETSYHNFKVTEIKIQTLNTQLDIIYDHNNVFNLKYSKQKGNTTQDKDNKKELSIQIRRYSHNNENVTIPIGTFATF